MATRDRTLAHASKPHHTTAAAMEHAQPGKTPQPKHAAPAVTGHSTPAPAVALALVAPSKAKQPPGPDTGKKMARAPLELVPPVKGPRKDPMGPDKGMHDDGIRPPAHGEDHAAQAPRPAPKPEAKRGPKHSTPQEPGAPQAHGEPEGKKQGHAEPKEPHHHPEEKKGGHDEKAKHGEHAEPHEAKHKGGDGGKGGVHLKMPEPPSHSSPATQKRIAGVKAAAGVAAASHAALPSAAHSVTEARGAVNEPAEEANAKAQENLVAALDTQAAPSPEIEEICKKIKEVIKAKRPPDEDSLVKADPKAMATAASTEVKGGVQGESKKVEAGYDGINQTPQGTPAKGGDMTPPPASVDTPPLNATQATPDAVPAQNVSLKADAADSKQSMDDAGMNKPTAQLVQTGPIAEARAGQGELDQKAEQDPAMVLAKQQESLHRAEGDMAALQQQALAALTSSRKTTVEGTTGHQKGMVLSEEQQRTQASADAQRIFQDAQAKVDALLKDVTPKALELWDQKIEGLNTGFKNRLKKVADWIEDRHSGAGGTLLGWWDDLTGLPGWVTDEYDAAEKEFGDGVCDLARQISVQVNTVIVACEGIIRNARAEISGIFAKLPEGLRAWAEGEQGKLNEQLNGLNQKAQQTRTDFNKQLVDHASQAVQDVREQIHTLREAAKGLIGKIKDAIGRFLDDPLKFIIDGLLSLVGIPPASFWSLIDKIAQVIGDIVDDPEKFGNNLFQGLSMGFSQFFDHFGKHLEEGFMQWLLGGIAAAGINLPKDFSLKSIITFFLELMGITWPNIRKILAKHVGEKNIALIEKVVSLMATLIDLGPAGVFEMIKEKLNPAEILKQIVKMAIDYLIEALVKQAVARILMLFNPVGAILQAIEAIYKVLKWIFHNAAKIFKLIETVVNGIADIMAGNLGGFANAVETGLAMLIAPVIDFIADYLGLGDLPDKVKERIEGFQQVVLGYVEQAIVFLIEKGKALLSFLGVGGKDKKDDRTEEEKKRDKLAAIADAEALVPEKGFDEEKVRGKLGSIKKRYNLSTLNLVVDSKKDQTETVHFTASASEEEVGKPKEVEIASALNLVTLDPPFIAREKKAKGKKLAMTRDELHRQVKIQEGALNNLKVGVWRDNWKKFWGTDPVDSEADEEEAEGRSEASQASRDRETAIQAERSNVVALWITNNPGKPIAEANAFADELFTARPGDKSYPFRYKSRDSYGIAYANPAYGKTILHAADQAAGGGAETAGLGGARENFSIGAQWGRGGRAEALRAGLVVEIANVSKTTEAGGVDKMKLKVSLPVVDEKN